MILHLDSTAGEQSQENNIEPGRMDKGGEVSGVGETRPGEFSLILLFLFLSSFLFLNLKQVSPSACPNSTADDGGVSLSRQTTSSCKTMHQSV